MHTLQMQRNHRGAFITLTYRDSELPDSGLLEVDKLQRFVRALRKRTDDHLSYLAAGEFGSATGRPHYHLNVIGWSATHPSLNGWGRVTDPVIQELWPYGETDVGTLTMASARYTSKYITKGAPSGVRHVYDDDGQVPIGRAKREFLLSSQKPALGRTFIERWWRDIYGDGFDQVIIDGQSYPPPRYYDKWLKDHKPEVWEEIRAKRLGKAPKLKDQPASWQGEVAAEVTAIRNAMMRGDKL